MRKLIAFLMLAATVAQAQLNKPVETASAVVSFTITNPVVRFWNEPNAFAGVGAKLELLRDEAPQRYGALNFIATSITRNGDSWIVSLSKTNINGRALPYSHDQNIPASDLLQEPFGFRLWFYFLDWNQELTGGEIALELNGVTNRFAIPPQTTMGNRIIMTRMDKHSPHSHKPIWLHRRGQTHLMK